jgi:hypothetical protein
VRPEELEDLFLQAALRRSQLLNSDVKAANREYDEIHRLKNQLRLLPDRGEEILKRVARRANLDVKLVAVAALLAVDEHYAIDALQQIAHSNSGLASFTAEMTIREPPRLVGIVVIRTARGFSELNVG